MKRFWYEMHWGPIGTDADGNKDLYTVVAAAFGQLWYVSLYVVMMAVLALHLLHGFQSAFQSLGLNHPRYTPVIKNVVEEVEGGKAIVWTSRSLSPEKQIMREEWVLERFDAKGQSTSRRLHTLTLRWFYRYEMEHLFESCGLKIIKLEGGFKGQPFAHGGEQLWTLARA